MFTAQTFWTMWRLRFFPHNPTYRSLASLSTCHPSYSMVWLLFTTGSVASCWVRGKYKVAQTRAEITYNYNNSHNYIKSFTHSLPSQVKEEWEKQERHFLSHYAVGNPHTNSDTSKVLIMHHYQKSRSREMQLGYKRFCGKCGQQTG